MPALRSLSRRRVASASLLTAATCTAKPPACGGAAGTVALATAGADATTCFGGAGTSAVWVSAFDESVAGAPGAAAVIFRRAASAAARDSNGPAVTRVSDLPAWLDTEVLT